MASVGAVDSRPVLGRRPSRSLGSIRPLACGANMGKAEYMRITNDHGRSTRGLAILTLLLSALLVASSFTPAHAGRAERQAAMNVESVAPKAQAATNYVSFRKCKIELEMPTYKIDDVVYAEGLFTTVGGCNQRRTEVRVCFDVKYYTNSRVWTAWRNASKADKFKTYHNGCLGYGMYNRPRGEGGFSLSLWRTWRPSDCGDFRGVTVRTSAWIVKDGRKSGVFHGDRRVTLYC